MGIGSTKDCPGSPGVNGPGGVVNSYVVGPGYYDVQASFYFHQ